MKMEIPAKPPKSDRALRRACKQKGAQKFKFPPEVDLVESRPWRQYLATRARLCCGAGDSGGGNEKCDLLLASHLRMATAIRWV